MEKETIIRYHLYPGRLAAEKRRAQTASNLSEYYFLKYTTSETDGTSV